MNFPVYSTFKKEVPEQLLMALGISEIINSEFNNEINCFLIEISDSKKLQDLTPDFEALIKSYSGIKGVLVTAASSNENYDFESRYFWPWSGTNEDPATGATHTFLTKYWSSRLKKEKLKSFQCSERSGFMEVELLDENNIQIKSNAVIVLEGAINL